MQNLVEILNALIEKYQIEQEDVNALQEALSELESGLNDEFTYAEEEQV